MDRQPGYMRYKNGIQICPVGDERNYAASLGDLFDLPFNVCFLNKNSQIQKTNEHVVHDYGFISAVDAVNRTVRDVVKMKFAQQMLKHNHTVINEGKLFVFEESGVTRHDIDFAYIVIKMPVYNTKNIIGLLDFAFSVKHAQYQVFAENLTRLMSTNVFGFNLDIVAMLAKVNTVNGINITMREKEIMQLIVRGKTAKEIAKTYGLSFRTVQHIIDRIKAKTGCPTKAALIEFTLDHFFN